MKKLAFSFVIIVFFVGAFHEAKGEERSVLLRWNIEDGSIIGFREKSKIIGKENFFDVKKEKGRSYEGGDFFEELGSLTVPTGYSIIYLLRKEGNDTFQLLQIVESVIMPQMDSSERSKSMMQMMKSIEGSVLIRCNIDESGNIVSPHINFAKKKNVALRFELPKKHVKIGDTWSIDTTFLSFDNPSANKQVKRTNQVKLTSLSKSSNGDTIATIEYKIYEKMIITSNDPKYKNEDLTMTSNFSATSKFLVEKGTLAEFKGRSRSKSTGIMTMDSEEFFSIMPTNKIPSKFLSLKQK